MSEENIVSVNIDLNNLSPVDKKTKEYLVNLSDEDVHKLAKSDPDCPSLKEEELKKIKKILKPELS